MTATQAEILLLDRFSTPIGTALLVSDEQERLRAFDWFDYEDRMARLLRLHYGKDAVMREGRAPRGVLDALGEYFAGQVQAIERIECHTGGTTFQRRVWEALRTIPAGQTMSYGELAAQIGSPKAVRAVGLANGANPVGLVVPCHRVIGANGTLTGYGGGLERKRWLLRHEGVTLRADLPLFAEQPRAEANG
jgi:methylated-DNA-[protein]-cysteine S-methyltransferase